MKVKKCHFMAGRNSYANSEINNIEEISSDT